MYILLSGKVPFPGESNKEIIENVIKGEYHYDHEPFKKVSESAKDLISRLLVKDVDLRYSATLAFDHPWIKQVNLSDEKMTVDYYDNMKNFMDSSKLKKTTLTFLASKLPENKYDDIRNAFIACDVNGDGKIHPDEFRNALNMNGGSYSETDI